MTGKLNYVTIQMSVYAKMFTIKGLFFYRHIKIHHLVLGG